MSPQRSSAPARQARSPHESGLPPSAGCRPLPERVQIYLDEVVQACAQIGLPPVSLILFGSIDEGWIVECVGR